MNRKFIILTLVSFTYAVVIYSQDMQNLGVGYQQQFDPALANMRDRQIQNDNARFENNLDYAHRLMEWINQLKGQTDETVFNSNMDYYYKKLQGLLQTDIGMQKPALLEIKQAIDQAILDYNKRNEELNDPKKYWFSGIQKYNNSNYEDAIDDFNKVVELSLKKEGAYYYLGCCYYYLKKYNMAIEYFNRIIAPSKEAYLMRGWAKYYNGNYIDASRDFTSYIELEPTDYYGYYSRGSAKSENEDNYGAIADYKKAIDIDPKISMPYNNLGWTYFKLKDYKTALTNLDIALKLDATNYIAWDSRAEIKFNLNDLTGCVKDCDKAIELNNKLSNSYFIRGRAKYRLGKKIEACQDWSNAGDLGKDEVYEYISKYCK